MTPRAFTSPTDSRSAGALIDDAPRTVSLAFWLHLALACVYVFLLPLLTFPKDVAFIAVVLCAVARLPWTWRCYSGLIRDRGQMFLLVWAIWTAFGLLWSEDWSEGWYDLRSYRVALTGFALWPVIVLAPRGGLWMTIAFLCGVAAQHGVQACQAMRWLGAEPGVDNRLGGWLHPIQTGTFCAAAMCLHLAALLRAPSWRWRCVFGLGLVAAGAGLVATGSRGAWLGGAVAIVSMLVITMIRRPHLRRALMVVSAVGVLAAAAALPLAWGLIRDRWDETMQAMERHEQGKGRGDAVTRLRSWDAAWEMFLKAPVIGVGTGDFVAEVGRTESGATIADAKHAHNTYLHVLACNGAIGFGLMMLCFGFAVRSGWREPQDWLFADGALFALVAWLIAAWFDAYQQNGQMLGLFTWLAVLVSSMRPRFRA